MLMREDIERRKPFWQALFDLWLADYEFDRTETNKRIFDALSNLHSPAELETVAAASENYDTHIVRAMIASGYSLPEIEKILCEEVAPVVYHNAYKPYGGEWGAFYDQWLFPEIVKNLEKQENNLLYRAWVRSRAGKYVMTQMVRDNWQKIVELYRMAEENKESR